MMIRKIATDVLSLLSEVLGQLTNESYTKPLAVFNGSSLGQHSRHVIEFYQCLMRSTTTGTVNYDARERSLRLENDVTYANKSIEAIMDFMQKNDFSRLNLALESEFGACHCSVETNFDREMIYLIEHSIHHFALLRIGLQENFPSVAIPPYFGIAYSTVSYSQGVDNQ
jgi:hypothetical protein